MRKIGFSLCLAAVAALVVVFTAQRSFSDASSEQTSSQREARIVQESGDVYVKPAGQDNFFAAALETPLETGDTVQTSVSGECDISLDGLSLLHLGEGSELNLAALEEGRSAFSVTVGGVLGKIVGKNGQPANMDFRTPGAWGGLRGTEIGVETDGNSSRFGVFDEGKFAIHQDAREILLTPHMEVQARVGEPLADPAPMKALLVFEKRMARLRQAREALAKSWKPASAAQRVALRQKLLAGKPLSAKDVAKLIERSRQSAERRMSRARRESSQRRHTERHPNRK